VINYISQGSVVTHLNVVGCLEMTLLQISSESVSERILKISPCSDFSGHFTVPQKLSCYYWMKLLGKSIVSWFLTRSVSSTHLQLVM